MEIHHEVALNQALDKLYLEGAISIPWHQLYLWFNAERLSKGVYREIVQRWEMLCERRGYDSAPELYVLDGKGQHALRVRREPFKTDEKIVRLRDWT